MTNAFEYGDALLPRDDNGEVPEIGNNQPYLNLATYVCDNVPSWIQYLPVFGFQFPYGSSRR